MKHSLLVYWRTFQVSLQAKLEYRVDFLLGMTTSCLLQLSALCFLWVVLHQVSEIGGWSHWEVLLLFGLTAAALGGSELFFNHIWFLPMYIVRGELDRLLTYPVRHLPFFLICNPELHSFGNLLTGLALMGIAGWQLQLAPPVWLLLGLWAACGVVIYTSVLVILGCLSFVFVGPFGFQLMLAHNLLQACRYPLNIYPAALRYLLLIVIPFGAFSYVPVGWFFGRISHPSLVTVAPLVALAAATAAQLAWNRGLRLYESAGS